MPYHLLVVEDEPAIADFLVRGLREEGYTVVHSADGRDAWHRLTSETWDVVLLDWWLPGIDGVTLLKKFRQINVSTAVLFLTARDAIADRVAGLRAGADDYLCKPFAFEELLARIHSLTRRQDRRADTTLSYGDVQYDLITHRIQRTGKILDLTAKECALLAYFLRHPGEVLSKTRIYENVWQDQYDGISNTLEVHVMELRRKLETQGPRLINTVRGLGYVLGEKP